MFSTALFLNFNFIIMFEFFLPLIQGVTSLASTVGSGVLNYFGTKETNDANREIASDNREWQSAESQKERNYQMEMWDRNNAYNSPAAEKARLMEAGLNPYLGNSQLGQGSTMPSPTSLQGAPNAPTMQNPFAAFDMRLPMDFMTALGQKKVADANSANQNAQSLTEVAKAAKELYDVFGEDKALQMIAPVYGRIVGASFDGNNFEARAKNELAITQSQREIQSIQAEISKKVGVETAEEKLAVLKSEFTKNIAEVGLWSSVADLNRAYEKRAYAEIPLLKAKCREAIASAYHHWQSGSLASEQSMTESQKRKYFVALLRVEAGMQSLDFLDREADYEGNEGVREWLRSDSGKKDKRNVYVFKNDPFTYRANQFTGTIGNLINAVPELKNPSKSSYFKEEKWYQYE